jgi:photosystem II stability/assembly factor-like uncharacterized protein
VNAVVVDPAGRLWFGTAGGGVSKFDGATWTTYTAADGLAGNVIYALAVDPAGQIWAGASGGLSKFDGAKWTSYTRRDGLPSNQVHAIAIDLAGHKWLGFGQSDPGLIEFDDSQWVASPSIVPTLAAVPVSTPPPAAIQITGRRLIDDRTERLYARGTVDGVEKTLVLTYTDERLLATYDLVGELALDSVHHRLYIDQGPAGLAVINTQTERLENLISLPESFPPALQADPVTGYVLAFRENVVYFVDPETGAIVDTLPSSFTQYTSCASGPVLAVPTIAGASYDQAHRVLYLASATSVCNSSASGGSGYGLEAYRLDSGAKIAPGDKQWSWFLAENWSGEAGPIEFDPQRQCFYEITAGSLRVFDAETMALTLLLPQPIKGDFDHYNPITDQLQFRVNKQVISWPASAIQPPAPEAPTHQPLPQTPVTFLAVSPNWAQDQTLFGLWVDPTQEGECQRSYLNWGEGLLFLSANGGQTWGQSRGGLRGSCELLTTLAVSPDYARDQTLFAGVWGLGIFKSTDGGRLWQPSGTGLTSMGIGQILLSPGFPSDQTIFAQADAWYRSSDGGQTWQPLSEALPGRASCAGMALSPEFDSDRAVACTTLDDSSEQTELYLSRNGGNRWELIGPTPTGVFVQMLSLAPLFAEWQTLFVYGTDSTAMTKNSLYRSTDGGHSWELVFSPALSPGPYATARVTTALVYAPGSEAKRLIFLLAGERIYHSKDGGLTWQGIELAEEVKPTALAISPSFAQDRTLFIGTANGQVLTLEVRQ